MRKPYAWMACLAVVGGMLSVGVAGRSSASESKAPLPTVASVDLNRYIGRWYEIARTDNRFERSCAGDVTATYGLLEDGQVSVLNECRRKDGSTERAHGKAKIADRQTNAKLRVTFFWPFYGDYWIIELDKDYRYAVVGEPDRKYLWILSRSAEMDDATYQRLVKRIAELGYDASKVMRTPQPSASGRKS